MYLLDTNVVSELRRKKPDPAVESWIRAIPAERLLLSAVTVGEIQAGIEITREQDPTKARELERWLDQVIASYQVLVLDAPVLREWARLMHRKSDTLLQDALIAATAAVHRLTVVTRNVRDFELFGVGTLNPFHPQA
ncbi:MAG: type II toxin-antitoxin system VapC family toxin [Acidobacteriota bacterium]|nr:type II toxin-antitoxin system VapC family toxin [Acidobacteriota bacterium]MXW70252.1 type II toxin-antitoxin system VapC family toxin [Acidobacteriota bacterium]